MMMDTTLVKHLVISEQTVFTVYVFLWAISAVVFYLLGKRAKNIEAKKRLDTIFFIIIALLMLLVGLLAHFPAVELIFLGMALIGFYFLSRKMKFPPKKTGQFR